MKVRKNKLLSHPGHFNNGTMIKLRLVILLFIVLGSTISLAQTPYFMQKNDTIYFIVFQEKAAVILPAYPDLAYHTRGASGFFRNGNFSYVMKERDKELWNIVNSDTSAFLGFVVYYNGVELMREDKQVWHAIAIIQNISSEYSKLKFPKWLEGTWGGFIEFKYDSSYTRVIIVDYHFDIEEGIFEVRYGNHPFQTVIDSVSSDYVRLKDLINSNDLFTNRGFGTDLVELKLLKKNETLHVQYPPADSNERMITGQLKKVLK